MLPVTAVGYVLTTVLGHLFARASLDGTLDRGFSDLPGNGAGGNGAPEDGMKWTLLGIVVITTVLADFLQSHEMKIAAAEKGKKFGFAALLKGSGRARI